jgi:hypothetical protein
MNKNTVKQELDSIAGRLESLDIDLFDENNQQMAGDALQNAVNNIASLEKTIDKDEELKNLYRDLN